MIEQRNIGVCLVLTIVTCGLYGLYWISRINDDSCELAGESSYTSGGMVVLFGIITCGLYTIYWNYKLGERLDSVRARNGEPSGSLAILYLVLCILSFSVISLCLAQSELNKYAV